MSADYRPLPELLPEDVIERARKLGTALLCDGMKGLGIPMDGCMEHTVMPVNPHVMMVGTAMTVDTEDGDNFPIHVATYSAKPGYVMVVDGKGYTGSAYVGDLVVGAAKAVGLEGMVIDGFSRDTLGIIKLGFPLFSKGIMQRGPKKELEGKINVPVQCGGIAVNPGDLVVGDADGVTVVPRDKIYAVLEKAETKAAYESKREAEIENYYRAMEEKAELPNLAPRWVLDTLAKINGDK